MAIIPAPFESTLVTLALTTVTTLQGFLSWFLHQRIINKQINK